MPNFLALVKKSNEIIVQSNRLIEAHYRLTLQEKRLILWLIKSIRQEDTDFKKYLLSVTDFAEIMELNAKTQYKEMKKITRNLITRPIEIEDTETTAITQMAWLCFVHWEPKKGLCSLQFHPALKPYLLQLKSHFTKIGLSDLLGLKSVYAVRIFELLIQYELIGKRQTNLVDIRSWCGVERDEYKLYAHLKSRIIEKAKTEINAKTEYEVDYEEIKESRKVVAINWTIKKKTHFEKSQAEKAAILVKEYRSGLALIERMREYGFARLTSKKFIQNHGEEVVKNALRSVDLQVERGHVKNPKAMLQIAIKDKWHPEKYVDRTKKEANFLFSVALNDPTP